MQIKNIKVLHIISSLGMGGAERQLLELTQDNNNHGICQLMQRESWSDNFLKDKNRVFSLGMKKGIPDPRAFSKLKRTIEIFKPHIIHTWMYHASLLEVLLTIWKKQKYTFSLGNQMFKYGYQILHVAIKNGNKGL